MKIIHLLGWFYPESLGGTEIYVAHLARRLKAAGHDVRVAAPDRVGAQPRFYTYEGIDVYRYPIPQQVSRAEAQGDHPVRGAEQLHRWLGSERPEILHLHTVGLGLGLAELRAAHAIGARAFVTSHSSGLGYLCQRGSLMRWGTELCDGIVEPAKCAACALQERGLPRSLSRALGMVPPWLGARMAQLPGRWATAVGMSDLIARNRQRQMELLDLIEKFVLLTERALEIVAENGAPRAKLVLNRLGMGHGNLRTKPATPTRSPIQVGYLGRFEAIKGVLDLAQAVARLHASVPLRLELRGPVGAADAPMLEKLQAITRRDPRIALAPAVAPADAPQRLASYDLLCCPSRCFEGGPTVAIEAHAVGTPVVGSRIGGLAELLPDDGRLFPPGDVGALSALLEAVAQDPTGTIDRWRHALPPVRTMDQVAAETLTMYGAKLANGSQLTGATKATR